MPWTSPSTSTGRRPSSPLALAFALAIATLLVVSPARTASVQDPAKPKKDAALEDLLEEIKTKDAKPDVKPAKPADADAAPPASKPAAPATADAQAKPPAGPAKPKADVAPKDKALDSLLEKLGESVDKPAPDDRPRSRGAAGPDDQEKPASAGKDQDQDPKPAPKPPGDRPKPAIDPLTGKAKELDEHLEELTGKPRKKPGAKEGDDQGPMSEVVKQMRDVEQRLGQEDTGEETRKKQQQIVKNLESLIEQMKQSGQSQGRQRSIAMKPGQKPGQNPGQNPGTTGGNAPFTKPAKPTDRRALAGGKDEWGHLPPELRQELENVFKEDFLPSRQDLIERYYKALAAKSVKRGEAQP